MSAGDLIWFVVHLVVSFSAGVVAVLAAAAIAILASAGSFALLEVRGVPVFLGVATSILVLALLRGRSRSSDPRRDWILVAVGFVVLVVAGVIVYYPTTLESVQASMERRLGVWTDEDARAVEDFRGGIASWNERAAGYQRTVAEALAVGADAETFTDASGEADQALVGELGGMRDAAGSAQNADLEESLRALADVYQEQLSGLRLVARGILEGDFATLRRGDDTYKDASRQVGVVFQERLRPLLERAELDATAFERTIAG